MVLDACNAMVSGEQEAVCGVNLLVILWIPTGLEPLSRRYYTWIIVIDRDQRRIPNIVEQNHTDYALQNG